MKVEISQENTVEQLFTTFLKNGSILTIPIYQREYSWHEEQWGELFTDLQHSMLKSEMDTNFWGNILIYHNEYENEYEIVDGQQRIVTILLLMLALGKIYNESEKLPFKFPDSNNEIWIKVAQNQRLIKDEKRSIFQQAKTYFIDVITKSGLDRSLVLNHLYNTKFSVVVIDDEVESNLLFGRLNTRGLGLNDVDLVKHKIFYETDRNSGPTNNDVVLEQWKKLYKITSEFNTPIEIFISKWWETRYGISDGKIYSSFLNELSSENYTLFLNELLNTANGIKNWRENDSGNDNKIGRNLKWLLKISKSTTLLNVIISLRDITFSNIKKIELFELLTMYEFLRAIILYEDFSELDKAYISFSNALLRTNKGQIILEREIFVEIDKLKVVMKKLLPKYTDFSYNFVKLRFDDKGDWEGREHELMLSRYAIYTLNNWLDITNHGAGAQYRTKDDDDFSIEHIRAKKNASLGEISSEYRIGNLIVFEKHLNNGLGDIDIHLKISEYKKSQYPQLKEFLFKKNRTYTNKTRERNLMEWDINNFNEENINYRGNYLASCFYSRLDNFLG